MILVQGQNFIVKKLSWHYEDFLKYCQEAGKTFVEELDREDFIAYRSEYAVSHKEIEQLKNALNFQNKQPVEELSPPQYIFDEPKDSLQKHFKIYDLTPYENILISDLDFNTRVRRCLDANNYVTLADILKSSRQNLFNLKNFGKGSADNLVATLTEFFDSKRKKISAEALRLADEALDEFLRSAALKHDPQIDLIIAAFETFSTSVRIKNFLKCLPEEIKSKRARPFLYACSLNNVDFFAAVPEDLPLAELPKFLAERDLAFGVADFETFVDEIRFDVGACAKKIAAAMNQREFEIVRRRAEGATLEETGRVFNITRERVRQLELKSLERFKRYGSDVRKIFNFLHALTDGKILIALDDMKAFVDTNAAEIIYFLAAKVDLRSDIFHFDKGLNSFVFHNGTDLDENELSKNLLDIMDENIFEA